MSLPSALPTSGYIRRFLLAKYFGVHVTTIDRWVRENNMPAPIKLGSKTTVFDAVAINAWLADRHD